VDYAFAPGSEPKLRNLQQLLRDRTDPSSTLDTTLIDTPSVTTIREFLRYVDTTEQLPTGDLILGGHGTNTGSISIDLDAKAPHDLTYQALKEAYDDTTRRNPLIIKADMYTTSSGQRAPVRVLLKGCRIGQQPKFVDGLTVLFGGKIPVIAPRHFEGIGPLPKMRGKRPVPGSSVGSIEYLLYSNELISPAELSRDALVKAYRAHGFTQSDGTTPFPDLWDKKWIPLDVSKGKRGLKKIFRVSLGRDLDMHLTTINALAEFRHSATPRPIPIDNPTPAVKTKAGFKAELASQPQFQSGWGPTGFPVHEQLGPLNLDGSPTTFDQFFDSYTWTPPKDKSSDPFIWTGIRHVYNVLLPVVKLPLTGAAADRLIYNWFPPRGGSKPSFVELDEGDTGLFYVSPGS
jgi:hypothetical protein